MIRVDAEIAERAKNIGLNISKVCENALFRAVEAMEQAYGENTSDSGTIAFARKDEWCDRRGSNPGPLRGRQESYH